MTRVNVLCEDRTGGGLATVLQRASDQLRDAEGKPRLEFMPPGTLLNNHALIEKCRGYDLLRFHKSPTCDHVYYVVDAKRLWDLGYLGLKPPQPNEAPSDFLARARYVAHAAMAARARGDRDDAQWAEISDGFHPCVLMWERESLIVPVADALGLGDPEADPDGVRGADAWVERRFRIHRNEKYAKSTDGLMLLRRIAYSPPLLDRVLQANASLREIVSSMVALP